MLNKHVSYLEFKAIEYWISIKTVICAKDAISESHEFHNEKYQIL